MHVSPDNNVKKDGTMMNCSASPDDPAKASEQAVNNELFTRYDRRPAHLLSDALIIDTLMNYSQDTIYFKDAESKFILNDRAHVLQFGVSDPGALAGKSDADFYPEVFALQTRQDELEIMRTGIPIINKMEQGINAAGEILTFSSSKYPLYNDEGKIIGTWGTSRDMTKLVLAEEELARVNAKLRALSLIDDLSGLYNQRHFYDSLEMTIKLFTRKRMGGYPADFCVIFLDIDHFKLVNDTFGHVYGDAAIRYAAGQILAHTRASDTAFRYGGDEYALILQDTDLSTGRDMAERLRKVIEQNPLTIDDKTIRLTASLGVMDFNNEMSAGELVQKADARLYQAKNEGRNRVI